MGQNGTRRNRRSGSAHSSKWQIGYIRIVITVVILSIVITLCCVMWRSEAYANAVSDVFLAILSTGLASEIILFIVGEREKKKGMKVKKEKMDMYIMLL